ncbi:hypothetical protein [Amycolatopsis sp. NBC_01480]|uniref:hypothetical protein n=1 Tax=Amycolatopsis sp. NBC_01480 TaxID=2903562 RepID=UPI002E29CFA0|nr:hypothetical protein [Amycolatopsis sp. NBC_01480]
MRRSRTSVIAIVLALLAVGASTWATVEPYTVRQDAAAVQTQAKSLAEQVADACAKGGPVAAELGAACAKAAEVADQPPVTAGPTPDLAELRAAARAAVGQYCAAHQECRGPNGAGPDLDSLTAAVLARIPAPKDGTAGTDGRDGRDAPPPDYAALVALYCAAHDECRGPAGPPGAAGAPGADGKPGPACPDGYELRDAVITSPAGATYRGKACIDPHTGTPPPGSSPPDTPTTDPPTTGG